MNRREYTKIISNLSTQRENLKNASNGKSKCFYKQLWKISFPMFANNETQLLNVLKNSLECINLNDLEFIVMNIFI